MYKRQELDDARYLEAIQNIKEQQLEDQIEIHHDDALTFDINDLKYQEFDCLFIDAAKAQYQKFFEKYMPLVQKNGICIVDNLSLIHISRIKHNFSRVRAVILLFFFNLSKVL